MNKKVDLDVLAQELLAVLRKHGLRPESFGVDLTLRHQDFEILAADHPGHQPGMILISRAESGVQWFVKITPRLAVENSLLQAVGPSLTREKAETILRTRGVHTFRGLDLHGLDLSHTDLRGLDFRGANLEGADLSWSSLEGADLRGTKLNKADLRHADLTNTLIDETTRIEDKWQLVWEILNHALDRRRDLAGADLSEAHLRRAYLFADLSNANLSNTDLTAAQLSFSVLQGANLANADLRGAQLVMAVLRRANLTGADLTDADTSGADFTDADLTGTRMSRP